MAETYSAEYTAAYITTPPGNTYAYKTRKRTLQFSYTQVLAGTAADTIVLGKLPPKATIVMWESYFRWATFTSGATLSVGWKAYKDEDGTTQALAAAGLLSAVSLTTDGAWTHGILASTPAMSVPVVDEKVLNNREEVTIVATIGSQAPGVGAKLSGRLAFYVA